MKGLAFDIRRYSVHDGPGIRVTVFLKGCPLSCKWCHNPEGISPEQEEVCRTDKLGEREFIRKETVGKWYSADELLNVIMRDQIFFSQSTGGVTFSGGEPLMQEDFLVEALQACSRKNLHTTVDTSGHTTEAGIRRVASSTDLFLYDLKHVNEEEHIQFTGVSNVLIINNLRLLSSLGAAYWVRIPVIPGFNESDEAMKAMRDLLTSLPGKMPEKICLLPYHRTGTGKNRFFSPEKAMSLFEVPDRKRLNEIRDIFRTTGIAVRIGG